MNQIIEKIKRIGSLRDMAQAMRLIENLGGKVIGWNGLTVSTLEHGDITFKEINGRVILK